MSWFVVLVLNAGALALGYGIAYYRFQDEVHMVRKLVGKVLDKLEDGRAALGRHGQHANWCALVYEDGPCNCGLHSDMKAMEVD